MHRDLNEFLAELERRLLARVRGPSARSSRFTALAPRLQVPGWRSSSAVQPTG